MEEGGIIGVEGAGKGQGVWGSSDKEHRRVRSFQIE